MLAICIPIYNQRIEPLLNALEQQIAAINYPIEIVLIDDASDAAIQQLNIDSASKHRYIVLEQNIGRSRIRNLFLKHTSADYLLFLDCDALVQNESFLSNYILSIQQKLQVVCGGRLNRTIPPSRANYLNWKYSVYRESSSFEKRKEQANQSFMTNNFLIERNTFESVHFDERLTDYGHEDTLFGFELHKRGITISHLDNPIFNGDIEDNATYLRKTEMGLINLGMICKNLNNDPEFISSVRLLDYYFSIQNTFTLQFIRKTYQLFYKLILNRLKSGHGSLKLFDFYKLGYFDSIRGNK